MGTNDGDAFDETLAAGDSDVFDETLAAADSEGFEETLAAHSNAPTMSASPRGIAAVEVRRPGDYTELRPVDRNDYYVVSELGRGGMGRVLEARDRRHHRTVAIKEMLRRSAAHEERFEREALITARLQHPSIVPVYEAGCWSSGEPFYAMKRVQGRPLSTLVAEANTLEKRLALLPNVLAVTEAIAYAHSEGVIHRDLKPANVLVGDFGETVVVDWGLARPLDENPVDPGEQPEDAPDETGSLTVAGSIVGTPAYMPPEQASGGDVDERADVYALGAMLYHVLSGAPPYVADTASGVLTAVRDKAPTSLRQRSDALPADLVAITNKAMARDVAARYASAGELAEELRRYTTGQLVGAHSYSASELLRRWLRRHRAAVSVAVALLATLAVVSVLLVRRIVEERDAAEYARARAERQRTAAERLVDYLIDDLADRLEADGRLELMAGVAAGVRTYYDELGDEVSSDAFPRRQGRLDMVIRVKMAQGDLDGAEEAGRELLALAQQQTARAPTTYNELVVAKAYRALSWVLSERGQRDEATAAARASLVILDRIVAAEPENTEALHGRAATIEMLGQNLFAVGDYDGALAMSEQSLAIAEQLVRVDPRNPAYRRRLGMSRVRVGDVLLVKGDHEAALRVYRSALAEGEKILAANPDNADVLFGMTIGWLKEGNALLRLGRLDEAETAYRRSRDTLARLVQQDPSNGRNKFFLATMHGNLSAVQQERGDFEAELEERRISVDILERLNDDAPGNAEWEGALGAHLIWLGDGLRRLERDRVAARELFTRGLAILERLEAEGRLTDEDRTTLIAARASRAEFE